MILLTYEVIEFRAHSREGPGGSAFGLPLTLLLRKCPLTSALAPNLSSNSRPGPKATALTLALTHHHTYIAYPNDLSQVSSRHGATLTLIP